MHAARSCAPGRYMRICARRLGCSGVRWEGAYSESSPDVCAGGRRRAAGVLYGMRICARAAPMRTCAAPATQVPPHAHTRCADCRLQNRRSQAVKTMFGKPRKRWYRVSSILCARAGAVVRESALYAHMRTRCADAQMRKCTAHARICAALLPCAHTHAHTRRRVHSCIQPKYIYIFPASLKDNARPIPDPRALRCTHCGSKSTL